MEFYEIFSEQEMPPFQKSQHKALFMSDNLKVLNDSQDINNVQKVVPESTEKVQGTEESNKPVKPFLSNLTELELSDKNLTELPDFFKYGNLKRLCIHDTLLTKLPDSIGELRNLHDLDVSRNELKELPEVIKNLKHLEKLDLSHNQLESLPLSYAKLHLLRELNLSHNNFKRLPKCLENGMGTLRVLNVSNNPHMRVNYIINSKYLEKFIARNNKSCGNFPDWILCSKFFNMKEIHLDNTQFDVYTFNGKGGNLYYTKLSMASSNLSSAFLDMMMEHMINLHIVNVGNEGLTASETGNGFNYLPIQNFRNPKLITELNFRGTGLASVPSTINTLCNLKKLDLGMNNIYWFPEEFCELKKLEYLKIDESHLISFPANIGNLSSIQEIYAQNNALISLPESFENLKSLRLIDLYNNNLKELPGALSKLVTVEGLDLERNNFATTDIRIGIHAYSVLREYFVKEKCTDSRNVGVKEEELEGNDDVDDKSCKDWFFYDSSDEGNNQTQLSCDSEENWDNATDTDDEYEPNSAEINYNQRSISYLEANLAPLGFCPANFHSKPVQREVASMRVYGSMSSCQIVEGQFDDA